MLGFAGLIFTFAQCAFCIVQQAVRRLMLGRQTGHIFGQLCQIAFPLLKDTGRIPGRIGGRFQPRLVAFGSFGQFLGLPFKAGNGFAGVAVQPAFAFNVLLHLRNPAAQRVNALNGLGFLIAQRVALNLQALQNCGGNRLFLAQGRQGIIGSCPELCGLPRGGFRLRRCGNPVLQFFFRSKPRFIRFFPAAKQQNTFGNAQLFANSPVARRLLGLPRQLRQLAGQLLKHIVDPRQIGFCIIQL